MPRKRSSLFIAELLPDKRGRGQSRGSTKRIAAEWNRVRALHHAIALHLDGLSVAQSLRLAGTKYGIAFETMRELFKVDAIEAARTHLREAVALRKITPEKAAEKLQALQQRIERNQRAQRR